MKKFLLLCLLLVHPNFAFAQEMRAALLVPLSGKEASLGQALLDAGLLALKERRAPLILMPYDSGATAESARKSAAQAINENTALILGPPFAALTPAVAEEARRAALPDLSFSNDNNLAGRGVYMMGITPEAEAEKLIAYALSQGMKRIAVLAPDTIFGRAMADVVRSQARVHGFKITNIVTYPPEGGEGLRQAVRRAAQGDYRNIPAFTKRGGGENTAATAKPPTYDTLLVAEAGPAIHLIAPLLTYYGVEAKNIRLLGPSSWENAAVKEPALQGAFIAGLDLEKRKNFENKFQSYFGYAPPRIAFTAFDAVMIAGEIARHGTEWNFLHRPEGFEGAAGRVRLLPSGITERDLTINQLTVQGPRPWNRGGEG
ncbi:MAG: penicillin-binding protein activator [Dongiaceae bacterium]